MKQKHPPELNLSRWIYHRLIVIRAGHGDFAKNNERLRHQNADIKFFGDREKHS